MRATRLRSMSDMGEGEREADELRGLAPLLCPAVAKFHVPQFAGRAVTQRARLGFAAVHSPFGLGLPPRSETAYDLPQFWVRLMTIGVSNGSRGVAFSDLTFSRRVL
jgi:hypothetical protein